MLPGAVTWSFLPGLGLVAKVAAPSQPGGSAGLPRAASGEELPQCGGHCSKGCLSERNSVSENPGTCPRQKRAGPAGDS